MQVLYSLQFLYTGCFWLIKFLLTQADRKCTSTPNTLAHLSQNISSAINAYRYSIYVNIAILWNYLPYDILSLSSLSTFKSKLRTFLFSVQVIFFLACMFSLYFCCFVLLLYFLFVCFGFVLLGTTLHRHLAFYLSRHVTK